MMTMKMISGRNFNIKIIGNFKKLCLLTHYTLMVCFVISFFSLVCRPCLSPHRPDLGYKPKLGNPEGEILIKTIPINLFRSFEYYIFKISTCANCNV